ncbi:MAG: hypothetical protein ACI8QC_003428 [Planctomycetota bacterium]|jgi:hypothetical protein
MLSSLARSWPLILALVMPASGQRGEATTLAGMLELPDGSAAVGARVEVRGSPGGRSRLSGAPQGWRNPAPVQTDHEGRYSITFFAPEAYQFQMDAILGVYPVEGWRWSKLPPSHVDLGIVAFQEPCFVVGHLEDEHGQILVDGWFVTGCSLEADGSENRPAKLSSVPDPASGEYRLGPFPPGMVELIMGNSIEANAASFLVEAKPDGPARRVLKYVGLDPFRRVKVELHSKPAYRAGTDPRLELVLLDSDRAVLRVGQWTVSGGWIANFLDVPTGEYEVELRDTRYLPQRLTGVEPGRAYSMQLRGSAALQLTVLDPQGKPLDAYGLRLDYQQVEAYPREFELRPDGTPAPVDGRVGGIVPGRIQIEVREPGGAKLQHLVGDLAAGETRAVSVRFEEWGPLQGRVFDAAGEPAAGVRVEYTRGAYPGLSAGSRRTFRTSIGIVQIGPIEGALLTDNQGRFQLKNLQFGQWTLGAVVRGALLDQITIQHASDAGPLRLDLPANAEVHGRLVCPPDMDAGTISVTARGTDAGTGGRAPLAVRVQPDGSFSLPGLWAGRNQFSFMQEVDYGRKDLTLTSLCSTSFELVPGAQTLVIELADFMPASYAINVRLGAEVMEGGRVVLTRVTPLPGMGPVGSHSAPMGHRATTDSLGMAKFWHLAPGTALRVLVKDPAGAWLAAAPIEITPKGNEQGVLSLELELLERELLLLDAGGQPLANTAFGWACFGYSLPGCRARTDQDGKATLRIPRGSYGLFLGSSKSPRETPFLWEPGAGSLAVRWPYPR